MSIKEICGPESTTFYTNLRMNTLLSHSTCNFILWYFCGGKNHSLKASRIIKLDPRKNFPLELECNYWSRWYSDEPHSWHGLQAWRKSCLSRGGRFSSVRKIFVTCFSYTSSWNSSRWFLLFQISSKKKKNKPQCICLLPLSLYFRKHCFVFLVFTCNRETTIYFHFACTMALNK